MEIIARILSFLLQAQAQAAPPQPSAGEIFSKMLPMFLMVFLIFYFMVIKPQQNKIKAQEALLKGLKKGDVVVSSGGIIGRVAAVEDDCVMVEVSSNVKLKIERGHVVRKVEAKTGDKTEKAQKSA